MKPSEGEKTTGLSGRQVFCYLHANQYNSYFFVMKHRFLHFNSFNTHYCKRIEINDNDHCRWSSLVLEASFSILSGNIVHHCKIMVTMVTRCNHLVLLTHAA